MPELIYEHTVRVEDGEGGIYVPKSYGQERGDGTWFGWLVSWLVRRNTPSPSRGWNSIQPIQVPSPLSWP